MYDDGYETQNDDSRVEDRNNINDEMDYPNIESPRLTNEILRERMIIPNRKFDRDSDEDYNVGTELEPEITNIPNPTIERQESNSTNQGDYEIIGDNQWRDTVPLKAKFSEENKEEGRSMSLSWKYSLNIPLVAKTDKGFSEISQQKKKCLGALVSSIRLINIGSQKCNSERWVLLILISIIRSLTKSSWMES